MSNVNHTLTQSLISPVQASGTVTHSFADGSLTVESEGRGWHCRRAASCVIVPQAGDTVLIARVDNRIWILAVLEQLNPRRRSCASRAICRSTARVSLASAARPCASAQSRVTATSAR